VLLENVVHASLCLTLQDEFFSKSSQNNETFLRMTLNIAGLALEGQKQGWSINQFANQTILILKSKTHMHIRCTVL